MFGERKELLKRFKEYRETAVQLFPFPATGKVPRRIVLSNETYSSSGMQEGEGGEWFGAWWVGDRLVLDGRMAEERVVLQGLLAREAFRSLLPEEVAGWPGVVDLGMEFARLQVRDDAWVEFWRRYRKPIPVGEDFVYNPAVGLPRASKISRGAYLTEALRTLHIIFLSKLPPPSNLCARILRNFLWNHVVSLTSLEALILQRFLSTSSPSPDEVARQVGRSDVTVRKVRQVRRKLLDLGVLHQVVNISWARAFDLRDHYIYLQDYDPSFTRRVVGALKGCPFLYTVHWFVDGIPSCLLVFLIPFTISAYKVIRSYARALAEQVDGRLLWMQEMPLYRESYNLSHYEQGKWMLDWVAWRYWLERSISGALPEIPKPQPFPLRPRVRPSRLDIRILMEVWRSGHVSQRQLYQRLHVNLNQLNRRLRFLRSQNIIQYRYVATNLGLLESCMLLVPGREVNARLRLPFSELPEYYVQGVTGDLEGCIYAIRLPSGGFCQFAQALRDVLPSHFLLHVSARLTGSRWIPPLHLYDWDNHQFTVEPSMFPLPDRGSIRGRE